MKKVIFITVMFISLGIVFSSCGGETYADKLRKANKAVNRFIDENNINVIYEYPENGVFGEKDYFKHPATGFYIRVINAGNDDKPISGKTDVYLRYKSIVNLLTNDTLAYSNQQGVYMDFRYGQPSTYTNSSYNSTFNTQEYMFLSQACVIPLEYGLGNNAEVSLIVPFENASVYQQNNYMPLYYQSLKYRFTNDETEE